jgi:hypothetical protein
VVRAWRQSSTIHAALTVRGARDRATGRTAQAPELLFAEHAAPRHNVRPRAVQLLAEAG